MLSKNVLTCVCADMPLEIEGVIKALSTEITQMSLLFTVTFQVSVQHALELENFLTHRASIGDTTRLR